MTKNKLLLGAIAAAIVVILGLIVLYAVSPMMAFNALKEAAQTHDKDKLDEVVDFPAVRDGLKSQISAAIIAKIANSPDMKNNPLMAIGALLAPAITDRMVDSVVTPDGLTNMLNNGKLIKEDKPAGSTAQGDKTLESHFEYRTLNRARVSINPKDSPNAKLILTMERRGLFQWKLIRIDIPANVVNDVASPETTASETTTDTTPDPTAGVKMVPYGCMAKAVTDVPSVEDPKSFWKAGSEDEVTQYNVSKKTGEGEFCQHGGYCYPRFQKGTKIEVLKLTNCNIGKAEVLPVGMPEEDDVMYDIDFDRSKNSSQASAEYDLHDKLMKMNLSGVAAGNVEMFYWQQPTSDCAALVRKALNGDQQSQQMLADNPPDYCTWRGPSP
jgi:hypothetical protein